MQVNCPSCTRPVETASAALKGPAQTIRCQWCGNHFVMHGGVPINTGEFRKISNQAAIAESSPAEEVWELSADHEPAPPTAASIFDDMDVEHSDQPPLLADDGSLMLFPTEDLSESPHQGKEWEDTPDAQPALREPNIPDLPSSPAPMAALVARLGEQSWSEAGAGIDENIPELPDFDDQGFRDAAPSSPPPPLEPLPNIEVAPAANILRSGPPPLVEESIDSLLDDFISDEGRGEELLLRFYIRRNNKDFGPFTEEEVHSLLEARKLMGDELSRLQHEKEWLPLRERHDFKPSIDILEKQTVRTGWDGIQPSTPESPKQHAPTIDLSEYSHDEYDVEDLHISESPEAYPPPAHSTKRDGMLAILRDIRFQAGLGLGVILLVAGLWWGWKGKGTTSGKPTARRHVLVDSLAVSDSYPQYKRLLQDLIVSFRKQSFHLSWYKVRFVYYMLDSHGEDRAVRADIQPITERLLKRNSGLQTRRRLRLAQALSLRQTDQIQSAFQALKTPLPPTDPEWGYLLARTQELLGKTDEARGHYLELTKKHPRHIRARLGLYRTHLALRQEAQAARYLYDAMKASKDHLPTQLEAYSFATRTGRWSTKISTILVQIKRQITARHYTQSSLAFWNALVARRHWKQRNMEKAIHRIERATTLAPQNYEYFLDKVQFYRWSRQYFVALRSIEKHKAWRLSHPALLFVEFAILRESQQSHKLEDKLNALQPLAVTPAQKSVLYTLLGDFYLSQHRESDALQSYLNARKARADDPSPPYGTWALIKLLMQEKKWKQAKVHLEALRQQKPTLRRTHILWAEYLFARKEYDAAQAEARIIKAKFHTHYSGYLLSSRIFRRTAGLARSIKELRRALYLHPQRPSQLLLTLSDLYLEQDEPEKALQTLERFEKILQGPAPCHFLKRKSEVLLLRKRCKQLVAISAPHCKQFEISLAIGQCAEVLEDNDKALTAYKRAQMLAPEALEPLQMLARYHKKQGNLSESTRLYGILNRKRPSDKSNLLTSIKLFEENKLYEQALQLVLSRRHLFRGDFDVELARARLEGSLHRTKRALKQLRTLQRKAASKEQKADLYHAFAITYASKKQDKPAIQYYQKAIALSPRQADFYLELGTIYYRTREYKECEAMAKQFLARARRRHAHKSAGRALKKACTAAAKSQ